MLLPLSINFSMILSSILPMLINISIFLKCHFCTEELSNPEEILSFKEVIPVNYFKMLSNPYFFQPSKMYFIFKRLYIVI